MAVDQCQIERGIVMGSRSMQDAVLAEILEELRHNRATQTRYFDRLQSNIVNDVLASGVKKFDGNGVITDSFRAQYGSIAVWNLSASTTVTVTSSPPASAAPTMGTGVHKIPAGGHKVCNLASTAYTIYGTATETCVVEVFCKPQPPQASAGTVAVTGTVTVAGAASDSDAAANAAANGLLDLAHGYIYNGTTWDRSRSLAAAADGLGVLMTSPPPPTATNDVSVAGAVTTRTINAVAGQRHRLVGLSCSYSAAASTGTGLLTVTDGATVIAGWDVPLAVNTPFSAPLPPGGLVGSVNTNLVINLAAGAAGTVGRLNCARLTC